MSKTLLDDSDSNDETPAIWEHVLLEDRILFHDQITGLNHECHPLTGRIKHISKQLPIEWSISEDTNGSLYTNTLTGQVTYMDPRLISTFKGRNKRLKSNHKFKFDKFSTASDVLLNKALSGCHVIVTESDCGLGLAIANHLVKAGATVICASMYCPNMAFPINSDTNQFLKLNKNKGNLFWIHLNPLDLSSIYEFVQIYQSLQWPVHICFVLHDLLTRSDSVYCPTILKSFNKLLNYIKPECFKTGYRALHHYVCRTVANCFGPFNKFVMKARRRAGGGDGDEESVGLSCKCQPLLSNEYGHLSPNGFELMMQYNFLAPALLIKLIGGLQQRTNQIRSSGSDLRFVLVTSEAYRTNNLETLKNFTHSAMIYTVPTNLFDRLKQYANSKFMLLLFIHQFCKEFDKFDGKVSHFVANRVSSKLSFTVCAGTDLLNPYCIRSVWGRLINVFCDPLVSLVQLIYLLIRPCCRSLSQIAANPIFSALFNYHWFRSDEEPICDRKLRSSIPYFRFCQLHSFTLDNLSVKQREDYAKHAYSVFHNAMNTN